MKPKPKMKKPNKTALSCLLLVLSFIGGLVIGGKITHPAPMVKTTDTVWSKSSDTVFQEITKPIPYYIHDTVIQKINYSDTVVINEVFNDYYSTRKYNLDFSNDTIGVFKVDATVSKNSLINTTSTVIPIIKTVTVTKCVESKPKGVQGYVILGTDLKLGCNTVQVGKIVKNKVLIGVSGVRMGNDMNYNLNIGLTF